MATIDTIADRSTGSAIAGKAYFETSTNKFIVFNGTAWIEIDSDGVGAVYQNRWGASFDGANDYLDCGNISVLSNASSLTMSGWFYFNTLDTLCLTSGSSLSNRIYFYVTGTGSLGIYFDGANPMNSSINLSTSQWYHLAIVKDGNGSNNLKLFINGSLSDGATGSFTSATSSTAGDNFWIGSASAYTALPLDGLADEVAVWGSALSDSDVTAIYNSGTPTDISSLSPVGYWRMGDDSNDSATAGGSIATITDSSGNGNDATQSTAANQPTFKPLSASTTSLSFSNSSDYLEKAFSSAPCAGAYTIGLWFKSTVNMSYLSLFESSDTVANYNGGFRIYRFSDGNIRLVSATTTGAWQAEVASPANATNLDTWHHIVITRSANGVAPQLYIDGATPSGTTYGSPMNEAISSTKLRIGSTYAGGLTGYMDEVSFFNSELTGSDLTAYLTANRGVHIKNDLNLSPTAYWRMGEDDSLTDGQTGISQISDASGNGNHATQSTAANQPTASVDPIIYV